MEKLANVIGKILVLPLVGLIWLYQKTISLDHSFLRIFYPYGFCKYYPSCSEYAKQVLINEGVVGTKKILKRLLSCTPNSLGGFDLP